MMNSGSSLMVESNGGDGGGSRTKLPII